MPKIFDQISPNLIKNIKLSLIECIGKIFNKNDQLKNRYLYNYKSASTIETTKDFLKSADWFVNELISLLDSSDRDVQYEALTFIKLICETDSNMQNILVNNNTLIESNLINSLKNLLRKYFPMSIRLTALTTLWILSGEKDDSAEFYDRKCNIYKMFDAEEFLDLLFEQNEEITLISLEAINSLLNTPLFKNKSNEIVDPKDEVHLMIKIKL